MGFSSTYPFIMSSKPINSGISALLTLWALTAFPAAWAADFDREAKLRIANFEFEPDFEISLFADESQLKNPTAICFDDQGRMYAAEIDRWRAGVEDIRHHTNMLVDDLSIVSSVDRIAMYEKFAEAGYIPMSYWTEEADRIRLVEDRDGDGRADHSSVFADGFDDALDGPGIGLVYGEGALYYTNIPHLWMLRDEDGDGQAEVRESLQEGFGPRMSISGHDLHGLIWGPDGRLYWSVGDRGYTLQTSDGRLLSEATEGAVFRCEPDGSELEVVYYGLRNPQELAFDQYGNLFTCDNDADAWDTGRLVYIIDGGEAGWDAGHQTLLNFRDTLGLRTPKYKDPKDGKVRAINPWLVEGLCETRHEGQPAWILPPIEAVSWGPSGLVYNYGATAFPDRYAEYFFVCNFGGARGDLEAFTVSSSGAGFEIGEWTKAWMVGLGNTDAEFGPDGRLYISCFNNNGWVKQDIGNVYTMYSPEKLNSPLVRDTKTLLTTSFDDESHADLAKLLGHPDMRVRLKAQFALAKRGAGALDVFQNAVASQDNLLSRLHGIWGLGQLLRQHGVAAAEGRLIALIGDPDAEVRAQAIKTLGESGARGAGEAALALIQDPADRVKAFAAIAAGRLGVTDAVEPLVDLAEKNADRDAFLRHSAVISLHRLEAHEAMAALNEHENPAVRRVALLTLRRAKDPRLASFVDDRDPLVRWEAVRAIHDLDITEALEVVAVELEKVTEWPQASDHRGVLNGLRLINANFRLGTSEAAERLIRFAGGTSAPAILRADALHALEEWAEPNPIDAVVGKARPLEAEGRASLKPIVEAHIGSVLASAGSESSVLVAAMRLAAKHGVEVAPEQLIAWLRDPAMALEVRLEAMTELRDRAIPSLAQELAGLVTDPASGVRSASIRTLMELDRERGIPALLKLFANDDLVDKQNALELMKGLDDPRVAQTLSASLDRAKAGSFPKGALLELFEALQGEASTESSITAFRASSDVPETVREFIECLEGGDVARGEELFANHPAGQCNKCHMVGSSGGIAGPDLSEVGARLKSVGLLESLVAPSAKVVPGYGLTMLTKKDGSSLGGNLLEENEDSVVLRAGPDADPVTIPRAEIANMNPPLSAMPPMGMLMKKRGLRDLVAYLAAQKTKSGGH